MNNLLAKHIGRTLDVPELERDLEELSGLDRYESITWRFTADATGASGLAIDAIDKRHAPRS